MRKCYIKGISEKLFNGKYIAEHTSWLVLHVLHFIGNFFYNPRASLARAAFRRDFLSNDGGMRSIAGTAQATLPHHPRPTLSPRTFALDPKGISSQRGFIEC